MTTATSGTAQPARGNSSQVGAAIAGTVVIVVFVLVALVQYTGPFLATIPPQVYGLLAVLALYGVAAWVTGSLSPLAIALGVDGRPSTSKFQFFIWTIVVVFGYVWFVAARMQHGSPPLLSDFPQNVLMAMGFSVATAAGAKGITVSYLRSGSISKRTGGSGGLTSTDEGTPDLSKIQMLIWTLIAAVCFIYQVASANPTCVPTSEMPHCFPDIDGALMVLMGLGQGAYLGNKLVSVDVNDRSAKPKTDTPNDSNAP